MPEEPISAFRKWLPLAVILLGLFVSVIDTTILNVSIGPIIRDLHISLTQVQWVVSAYSLTLAALLVTGGRLGDTFGKKRMFMLGAVIFAIGSVVASYAHGFSTMIIGESIIEGFGAALMSPATSALLVMMYKGHDRRIAYGLFGSAASLGLALGPLLGGFFATHYSWRWSFRINLVVVALLLIGSRVLPKDTDLKPSKKFDFLGVLLSALGVLTIMYAVIESSEYGVLHARVPFSVFGQTISLHGYSPMPLVGVIGVTLIGGFLAYEANRDRRGLPTLVTPHIFHNRQFSAGTLCVASYAIVQASTAFALALFFQTVIHFDSQQTSYVYLPLAAALLVSAPVSSALGAKIAPKRLIQAGFVMQGIAALLIHFELGSGSTIATVTPALVMAGLGLGTLAAQGSNLTLSAVPQSELGEASGIMRMVQQVCSSLGIAIAGAVILSVSLSGINAYVRSESAFTASDRNAVTTAVQTQGAEANLATVKISDGGLHARLLSSQTDAVVKGNKTAFLFIFCMAIVGLLASTQLPLKAKEA